ncbi:MULTISPECIES: N-acetyl-gamma-glutamyl-phosphate reductase [Gulosibacter]|uniref:N-acetyl-gamma-glutamyl-phosphate reductase n=1 Tax=Gulosibacter TaxID=256818 RepID=UPI000F640E05|nr:MULTISPECIES: N-acetyl-gamma-glutamyl-phosphate reductase [Gulosibacter]
MTFSVAVAGASGYGGGELLRLLASHPEFEVRTVTAHQQAGQSLRTVHPHLASYGDLELQPTDAAHLRGHDIVFLALPHGKSAALSAELEGEVRLLVDAGADHRLEREQDWTDYYPGEFAGTWTYGMPELVLADGGKQRAQLPGTNRIAVPGCNVTAVSLALAPAIRAGLVEPDALAAVLAVGPSGAGKKASVGMLGSELIGNVVPYNAFGGHRHNPEIRQNLRRASGADVRLSFTPVLVPAARGILATSSGTLIDGVDQARIDEVYREAYGDETFIEVLTDGRLPRTNDVLGSNRTQIAVGIDERAGRLIAISALDNLGKGTAGAAIQSANLALGLEESLALPLNGVAP